MINKLIWGSSLCLLYDSSCGLRKKKRMTRWISVQWEAIRLWGSKPLSVWVSMLKACAHQVIMVTGYCPGRGISPAQHGSWSPTSTEAVESRRNGFNNSNYDYSCDGPSWHVSSRPSKVLSVPHILRCLIITIILWVVTIIISLLQMDKLSGTWGFDWSICVMGTPQD